jgi:PilZ domain
LPEEESAWLPKEVPTTIRWRSGGDGPVSRWISPFEQGPTRTVGCEGQGTDLNGGGLAAHVEIDLEVGGQVAVEFTPPYADQPLAFQCFVRNRNGNRYGVEFIT